MQRVFRVVFGLLFLLSFLESPLSLAQSTERPLILPAAGEPGPSTWMFGQPYGNTVGAYNFGDAWYRAGQGLHFGLDFPMPCGTRLVAVADGIVDGVDNLSRGSGPHNLLLRHPQLGITTLYGHMLEPSHLQVGQAVQQGDFVGLSGDPDGTCDSRPHLHLEIRSLDYFTAYNPIDYIDANWDMLTGIGGYSYPLFQGDMNNPRRWMTLQDQPDVRFGGQRLNGYTSVWPLPSNLRPPANATPARNLPPLPEDVTWQMRQLDADQCCWQKWWDASDPDRFYVIDGTENQRAGVIAWSAASGQVTEVIDTAPPAVNSPDGNYAIYNNGAEIVIRQRTTGEETRARTGGITPALNTDNTLLTWTQRSAVTIPGQQQAEATIWVSGLDGTDMREVITARGVSSRWLDAHRLLLSTSGEGRQTTLTVFDTRENISFDLGTWTNMRNVQVAPGGERLMFYLSWQEDPAADGIYVIETERDAQPQHLPWFGGWRWRDATTVYYLPFEPSAGHHTLRYYDLVTGEDRLLASPDTGQTFSVMNGDWDVSADGRRIIFHNGFDWNLWLLEMVE